MSRVGCKLTLICYDRREAQPITDPDDMYRSLLLGDAMDRLRHHWAVVRNPYLVCELVTPSEEVDEQVLKDVGFFDG